METPKKPVAGRTWAHSIEGTFLDSTHAEGTMKSWLTSFSGIRFIPQVCPTGTISWTASWVSASGAALGETEKDAYHILVEHTLSGTVEDVVEIPSK